MRGIRGMGEWVEVRREPCDKLTMSFTVRGFLARSPPCRVFLRDVGWAGGPAGSGGQSWEVTVAPYLQLNLVAQGRWDCGDTGYSHGALQLPLQGTNTRLGAAGSGTLGRDPGQGWSRAATLPALGVLWVTGAVTPPGCLPYPASKETYSER